MVDEMGAPCPENRMLQALLAGGHDSIRSHLELVSLPLHRVIFRAGASIDHLYFINRGLVSRVKTMEDGRIVDIGAVGSEGIVGLFAVHGIKRAMWEYAVRIPGTAFRIDFDFFERKVARTAAALALLRRYSHVVVDAFSQAAACNRLHTLRQRCCHWLLVAHDNSSSDSFPVTHELLALTLGVQRAGVSIAANSLQKAGLIQYKHGYMTIIDRSGLEAEACECYAATCKKFDELLTRSSRKESRMLQARELPTTYQISSHSKSDRKSLR